MKFREIFDIAANVNNASHTFGRRTDFIIGFNRHMFEIADAVCRELGIMYAEFMEVNPETELCSVNVHEAVGKLSSWIDEKIGDGLSPLQEQEASLVA